MRCSTIVIFISRSEDNPLVSHSLKQKYLIFWFVETEIFYFLIRWNRNILVSDSLSPADNPCITFVLSTIVLHPEVNIYIFIIAGVTKLTLSFLLIKLSAMSFYPTLLLFFILLLYVILIIFLIYINFLSHLLYYYMIQKSWPISYGNGSSLPGHTVYEKKAFSRFLSHDCSSSFLWVKFKVSYQISEPPPPPAPPPYN